MTHNQKIRFFLEQNSGEKVCINAKFVSGEKIDKVIGKIYANGFQTGYHYQGNNVQRIIVYPEWSKKIVWRIDLDDLDVGWLKINNIKVYDSLVALLLSE